MYSALPAIASLSVLSRTVPGETLSALVYALVDMRFQKQSAFGLAHRFYLNAAIDIVGKEIDEREQGWKRVSLIFGDGNE